MSTPAPTPGLRHQGAVRTAFRVPGPLLVVVGPGLVVAAMPRHPRPGGEVL